MVAVVEGEANERQGGQGARRARLLTALYIAQEQYGWLSPQAVERVARRFDMVPSQVYATASFYTLFKLAPQGRYCIRVCEGLSCYLVGGAEPVIDHISRRLGLHYIVGERPLPEMQALLRRTAPAKRRRSALRHSVESR